MLPGTGGRDVYLSVMPQLCFVASALLLAAMLPLAIMRTRFGRPLLIGFVVSWFAWPLSAALPPMTAIGIVVGIVCAVLLHRREPPAAESPVDGIVAAELLEQ